MTARLLPVLALPVLLWSAPPVPKETAALPRTARIPGSALARISADSMRGNVSFLASDLLEGRETPSRGLDVAAEFIASRFRAAGLEPAVNGSYFQVASWRARQIEVGRLTASLEIGGRRTAIEPREISSSSLTAIRLERAPVFKTTAGGAGKLKELEAGSLAGSVVLLETIPFERLRKMTGEERSETQRQYTAVYQAIERLKPAAIFGVRRDSGAGAGASVQLIDPEGEKEIPMPSGPAKAHLHSRAITEIFDTLPEGRTDASLSFDLPEAVERQVELKNVVGLLPGSDPLFKDRYVIVTAHYDHVGRSGEVDGDRVFNGANDDASGVASLIDVATALAAARPKRSIVFIALFGEEKGLLGSYYYTKHPLFPLEKTVANLNLEHMGRTDAPDGASLSKFTMTGMDYSDIRTVFETAARQTGTMLYRKDRESDSFFNRSDNAAFAEAGIPAHTFVVSYDFPDYHGLGDHWEKIDYQNMVRIARTMAAGIWELASRSQEPAWNTQNSKADKYRVARDGNKSVP